MSQRPNILFILTDDHAVSAISALGSTINSTPNIDRIAASGGVFENSFCCNSLCAPSRAAILTGKHSHMNGQTTLMEPFDGSQPTLPKMLQASGYQTSIFGKWHLHSEPTGFDTWSVFPGQGHYFSPEFITPEGMEQHPGGYSTDVVTDKVLHWLKQERADDRPFMTCCHFKAPHRPWMPHPRYYGMFRDTDIPVPETLFDDYSNRCDILKKNKMQISKDFIWDVDLKVSDPGPNKGYYPTMKEFDPNADDEWNGFARMTDEQRALWEASYGEENRQLAARELSPREMTEWSFQRYVKEYLRCVAGIDDNVGRLLDYLDASGLANNTIVIYCSDQGFYLGEHGWYDKRWMFEESLRMPLLMRWPNTIAAGSVFTPMVQNIDYAPTLLEAAGLAVLPEMQGHSILPIIESGATIRDTLYYRYYEDYHGVPPHDGVRTDRYKLINFFTDGTFNLFDLEEDAGEMHSVHDDPRYTDVLSDMMARYEVCKERYQAPESAP